jgi:hypothetical protein
MEIEFLIIADAAEVVNNKLYMMGGGWNQWRSPTYPAPIRVGIAVGLLVPWDQTNEKHPVRLSIVDADGNAIVPNIGAQVEVGRPPGITAGSSQRALLAINAGFPVPKPGRYEVCAVAGQDGMERRVTFEAVLAGGAAVQIQ